MNQPPGGNYPPGGYPPGYPGAPQQPGYGQPQQPGYGQPPAGGFGGQMQGAFGAMQGAMQGAMGQPGGYPGQGGAFPRPKVRNPIVALLIPIVLCSIVPTIFGVIAGAVDVPLIGLLGSLSSLVGAVLALVMVIKMVNEMKAVTRNDGFAWWPIFIPIYSIYWAWIMVPQEMAKAKQMAGVQTPPRGIVVYIFFFLYALAADLNDIAKAP
jgi:hypothetical protein